VTDRHGVDRGYRQRVAATRGHWSVRPARRTVPSVSFAVGADAYDRFMGRYSMRLAPSFAGFAGVGPGDVVLDVGCGPGALTGELAMRVAPGRVIAVDPSRSFVEALRRRHPTVAVHRAAAEALPFEDGRFDATLAQLVVHFMREPVAGLREMARVTRPGGVVAACVWDHAGGGGPLAPFWSAARGLDPTVDDESGRAGTREGHLVELFGEAGLVDISASALVVTVEHPSFDEWWEPFMLGVGPAGSYTAQLDTGRRADLRERCRANLPLEPFAVTARAWAARGVAA
jgi:SAM-dependent methyltransferase